MTVPSETVELSVVSPAHNERDNIPMLLEQITRAIEPTGNTYEIIIVDDASTDDTLQVLKSMQKPGSHLRIIHLEPQSPNGRHGQSAAFKAGIDASSGRLIVSLDADLQNDPADIPRLLADMNNRNADLVQGDRSQNRKDSTFKRFGSLIGRIFRRLILGDTIRDTGCSLRIMTRSVAESLPLEYRGMHRFIPICARDMGFIVVERPVNHRPRMAGRTKYSNMARALPGLIDCFVVRWMRSRRFTASTKTLDNPATEHISIEPKPGIKPEAVRR